LLAEPVNKANVLFEIAEGINHDYILLLEGKYFIKKEDVNRKDNFESAIDDYYSNTIRTDINPTEEDLEKMKISLNWLTKNRNKVRIFYLKDFDSKEELFGALSSNKASSKKSYRNFNIKKLAVSKLSHDEEYFD
jgi:DNA polymerase-3 subunit epsilon